jgi:hypothetical protein
VSLAVQYSWLLVEYHAADDSQLAIVSMSWGGNKEN